MAGRHRRRPGEPETIAEVLASIRALVSAETEARLTGEAGGDTVLMLTAGDARCAGGGARRGPRPRPGRRGARRRSSTRQSLRGVINAIVREELQGELGDRINRNLRKLIRREIAQMLEEQQQGLSGAPPTRVRLAPRADAPPPGGAIDGSRT